MIVLFADFGSRGPYVGQMQAVLCREAPGAPRAVPAEDWPDDLSEVIYIDGFGNAMTCLRAATLAENAVLRAAGRRLGRVGTFSDVAPGDVFWYDNANGLAEIAVNRSRAADLLDLTVGSAIDVEST